MYFWHKINSLELHKHKHNNVCQLKGYANVEKEFTTSLYIFVIPDFLCTGVVGDWKTLFTVAQNEKMDSLIAEKFKDSIFKINSEE